VGEQRVVIRRIGFARWETHVTLEAGKSLDLRILIGRAIILEPVTVKATPLERAMESFDEHRKVGLGRFMTRADIAKYDGMKLAGVLEQIPGVVLLKGTWVMSKRSPKIFCPMPAGRNSPAMLRACLESHGAYVPEDDEARRGVQSVCYPLVYVDKMLVTGHKEPTEPFDVNTVVPERIEAIEFYAGAAQTPLEYSRLGSNCGVLVIWTRR